MTILLCGIPSEPSLAMVREQLAGFGSRVVTLNQRHWRSMSMEFEVAGGAVSGSLTSGGEVHRLEQFDAVFTRLMDDQQLPDIRPLATISPERFRCRRLHEVLSAWFEVTPARVVNRSRAQGSNFSKPYQAQLIRSYGFSIPETLVTNDPSLAREFWRRHRSVVYKSMSGIRSIVQAFRPEDEGRLELIRWCPVQFQAYVAGNDVRVHVLRSDVFATEVRSEATDYRYAHRSSLDVQLQAVDIPDDLADRCVRLSAALGLPFSGIDLRITPGGEAFCFEVNPSPAFSFYESTTGQPIAKALARYLTGE